jgi:hypothetical protein
MSIPKRAFRRLGAGAPATEVSLTLHFVRDFPHISWSARSYVLVSLRRLPRRRLHNRCRREHDPTTPYLNKALRPERPAARRAENSSRKPVMINMRVFGRERSWSSPRRGSAPKPSAYRVRRRRANPEARSPCRASRGPPTTVTTRTSSARSKRASSTRSRPSSPSTVV